jgi:replication factor A1
MNISEIRAGTGNITVEGEITAKDEPRDVLTKFGKKMRVCNATLKDESGEIVLSLWNDDIEKVNQGDKIKIENGWASEFKSNVQLSAGKFGKIVVLGK